MALKRCFAGYFKRLQESERIFHKTRELNFDAHETTGSPNVELVVRDVIEIRLTVGFSNAVSGMSS